MEKAVEASRLTPIPGKRFLIRGDRLDEHQVIRMDSVMSGYRENGKVYVVYDREQSG